MLAIGVGLSIINCESGSSSGASASAPRPTKPQDQEKFESFLKEIKKEYQDGQSRKNGVVTASAEGRMKALIAELGAKPKPVSSWLCEVSRIRDDKAVICVSGGVMYRLTMSESSPAVLSQLSAGSELKISGRARGEASITISGAISEPEIIVDNVMVEVVAK